MEGFKLGDYTEEYAVSLKNQLKDTKVAILGSYINPSNPNDSELDIDIKKFKEKIRYAKTLKPIAVGTETGIYKEGKTDTEEAYQYLLKNLKELVIEAERVGVNVGIEGVHCFVINTPQKMKRLICEEINECDAAVAFENMEKMVHSI